MLRVHHTTGKLLIVTLPPLIASHRDNYEIIKILRTDCPRTLLKLLWISVFQHLGGPVRLRGMRQVQLRGRLRHSRYRINFYRALASPSLIAHSSKDPSSLRSSSPGNSGVQE
ncbi:hypothetical protein TNIN_11951 [Trichonephila inaurata madagascariensis]|uniref:Transient receptor ion channel domain-containing protein n=1 Tax=Trichonephila inaurata madagascariensis TaxID=2747483 RepID=A0A8X6YMJ3_9ARAC|nr:hypothetical protein TNIN_11951 [Trichonephila inaurata madagascariensis]